MRRAWFARIVLMDSVVAVLQHKQMPITGQLAMPRNLGQNSTR